MIFSFGANEESDTGGFFKDEDFDAENLDKTSRDFLEEAIKDYNQIFHTNYDTSADKFEKYYKNLSQRLKNCEIDLLIVVNMFLAGFDSTTLNTLWLDKNLYYHSLLQAFSRTNRIFNSVKTYGNIVCFRDLEEATNEALTLFGAQEAGSVIILKTFADYYYGWIEQDERKKGYVDFIEELKEDYPLGETIVGEQAEKAFIKLWGMILKRRNTLRAFDEFAGKEILSEGEFQDYQSLYLDLHDKYRPNTAENEDELDDDLVFETELIKQLLVNLDYILSLVKKYRESGSQEDWESLEKILNSSIEWRPRKDLIQEYSNMSHEAE